MTRTSVTTGAWVPTRAAAVGNAAPMAALAPNVPLRITVALAMRDGSGPYATLPGYDLETGLGTFDINAMNHVI